MESYGLTTTIVFSSHDTLSEWTRFVPSQVVDALIGAIPEAERQAFAEALMLELGKHIDRLG